MPSDGMGRPTFRTSERFGGRNLPRRAGRGHVNAKVNRSSESGGANKGAKRRAVPLSGGGVAISRLGHVNFKRLYARVGSIFLI
jgi:hypothetical protein